MKPLIVRGHHIGQSPLFRLAGGSDSETKMTTKHPVGTLHHNHPGPVDPEHRHGHIEAVDEHMSRTKISAQMMKKTQMPTLSSRCTRRLRCVPGLAGNPIHHNHHVRKGVEHQGKIRTTDQGLVQRSDGTPTPCTSQT